MRGFLFCMVFKNVHKNVQTIKKKFKNIFISENSCIFDTSKATKQSNKPYQNEKINCVHNRNAQARPRVHTFSHRHHCNGHNWFHRILSYNLIMMTWRMKFRYHITGSYFVTKTFADIREANRYIKQEELAENSEFLTYQQL